MRRVFLLTLVLGLVVATTVHAQVPAQMSYQGYLEDSGTPVNDASATLTFRLLNSDASIVWTETHTGVNVQDGLFDVLLGSQTALTGYEFFEALTLEVDYNSTSLGPRAPLMASPYTLGLHLPLVAEAPVAGTAFLVHNTSENGNGIKGETQAQTGQGVFGQASSFQGESVGVYGLSSSAAGTGVYGLANTSVATNPNYGVFGKSNSESG